jgi:hypothetical protein
MASYLKKKELRQISASENKMEPCCQVPVSTHNDLNRSRWISFE